MLFEYRLVWKLPREGEPALSSVRPVADEQEGRRLAETLEQAAFDIDVLSGAKDCSCRKPAAEPVLTPPDYKMRQAGDR